MQLLSWNCEKKKKAESICWWYETSIAITSTGFEPVDVIGSLEWKSMDDGAVTCHSSSLVRKWKQRKSCESVAGTTWTMLFFTPPSWFICALSHCQQQTLSLKRRHDDYRPSTLNIVVIRKENKRKYWHFFSIIESFRITNDQESHFSGSPFWRYSAYCYVLCMCVWYIRYTRTVLQ